MPISPISPSGVGTAILYNNQSSAGTGYTDLIGAAPPFVNAPIFYEPQASLTQGELVLWVIVTGRPPNWGGAQVWASVDGTSYGQLGTVGQGGIQGVLTNNFPAGSDPDTTDTLSVDTSMSGGVIAPGSSIDADLGITLGLVTATELVGYSSSVLVSPNNYDLGVYIRRGMFQSLNSGHASGDSFGVINGSVFKYEYPPILIGHTVYFKFPSFNTVGGGLQDLSTVVVYSYTLTGAGRGPSGGGPGSGTCSVITVLSGGACCVELGVLGECVSDVCDLGVLGTPVTLCIDLGVLGR